MLKHRSFARWRLLIPLFLGFVLMGMAFVGIGYTQFKAYTIEDRVTYAYGLNSLIADELDVEHVPDYIEQGHDFPGYDKIEEHLTKLHSAFPDIAYLYVYQIREDGCHVVFDVETEDTPASPPGSVVPFDPTFEKYIPNLLAGKEIPAVISDDFFGYLLTIYTPMYDSQGVCQCYVAVDYSMHMLNDYIYTIIRQILLLCLAVVCIIVVLSLLYTYRAIGKSLNQLERRAYRDTLTGLQNRTAYYEYNQILNRRIEGGGASFSIVMVDINYLKRINDYYGHDMGNIYLKKGAQLIADIFGSDHLYRMGGDEFVVLLEERAQKGEEEKIQRFREEVEALQTQPDLDPWQRVSAAIGLASFDPKKDACTEDVLKRADANMYEDKVRMKAVREAD